MTSKKCDLLIIGGGTGGLVLALLMAKKGKQVAILDQKADPMPLPRGEILQPNGLKVLDQLGLLHDLLSSDVHVNEKIHFHQAAGAHLCTIDYTRLDTPYAYSLILLPEVLQRLLLSAVAYAPNITTFWGMSFDRLLWEGGRIIGACAGEGSPRASRFETQMVVGSDGGQSRVREAFGVPYQTHAYADGYVTMVVDRPPGFQKDSRYYLGKEMIFGAFPVSRNKIYLFYLVPSKGLEAVRARGVEWLKREMCSLHPGIEEMFAGPLQEVTSWQQTAYMRCFRVRCDRWVVHGGALLGDAAHAMNPHVAQGRNAAMTDAVVLADVMETCFKEGNFSQEALASYEHARRAEIRILQSLGDEMVLFWNSASPPLVWLRDRVFKKVQDQMYLHDKLLKTVAGLEIAPFHSWDRFRAVAP